MSGGRFLFGLNVVINSEKILSYRALIKIYINFRKECLTADKDTFERRKQMLVDVLNVRSKIWRR